MWCNMSSLHAAHRVHLPRGGGEEDSSRQGPSRAQGSEAPTPPTTAGIFLSAESSPSQLIRMLLLRAGDVEQNPGPTCKACNIAIAAGKPYLSCASCDAISHKGEKCSGLSRTRQALDIWNCKSCAQDETQAASTLTPPSPSPPSASSPDCTLRRGNQVTLVGQVGAPRQVFSSAASSHRCTHCDRVVRATRFPIKCGRCDMLCHKSCTGLVRARQLVFIDSNAWRCEGCSKKSNSAATDPALRLLDASVKRSDFGSRNSIRMLQWNAKGLKTKMVELADAV